MEATRRHRGGRLSPFDQGSRRNLGRRVEPATAFRFLIDKGTWTIPKAATIEHLEENARALSLELSPAEMERLESAFPKGEPGPLPML